MKLADLKTTSAKIEHGAWVGDLPNLPGVRVKVRGYGNSDWKRLLAKIRSGLSVDQAKDQAKDPAEQERVDTRLLHETILVDWDGIEDAPYSSELALDLLTNPDFGVFRSAVDYASNVVAREGRLSLEADVKN